MGVVYLADDPLLNRQVAIKTVDLAIEEESEREFLRGRLLKDARAAASLTHPGIVSVYDVLEEGNMAYLVMEYIAGESLAAILRRTPVPETSFTMRVLREMAAALDYTHARGIVHRDIKPANVMIDSSGAAKIMDFGIARMADTRTSTPTGMVMGTIQYMAPEQVKGESVNGKADQFALAAVAYEMMTGATLFGQHTLTTLAYKIVNEAPAPVRERNAAVPPAVDAAISRALSKMPQDRFASCGLFVAALERGFAGGVPANSDAPTITLVTEPPTMRTKRRSPMPLVAGVVAAAALAVGAVVWHPWTKAAAPVADAQTTAPVATPPPPETPPATPIEATPAAVKKAETAAAKPAAPANPAKKEADEEQPDAIPDEGTPAPHPAIEAFEHAKQLNQSGQSEAAIQSLNQAISIKPRYAPALVLRGQIEQKLSRWQAAADDYSQALRVFPKHAQIYLQRGLCYVQLQKDDLALADFDQAIENRPGLYGPHNQRGWIYWRRKDYPKALADFNQAIQINAELPFAYQGRANVKRAMGNAAGAREDMRRYRELKPGGGEGNR